MASSSSVLVTGAAHGIGLATAQAFHASGYRVAALDRDGESLSKACSFAAATLCLDVVEDPGVVVEGCGDLWPVDVLVNNVGVMAGRSFLDLPGPEFEAVLRTNLIAPYTLTRRWSQDLIAAQRFGSCVFISSLHARRVCMSPDYSCSKAAIAMLVDELASELGPFGIRVNAVSPGAIDTLSDSHPDPAARIKRSEDVVPLRRIGDPADVAETVVFLADNSRARYVTGANLRVDGGLDTYNWLHHWKR